MKPDVPILLIKVAIVVWVIQNKLEEAIWFILPFNPAQDIVVVKE